MGLGYRVQFCVDIKPLYYAIKARWRRIFPTLCAIFLWESFYALLGWSPGNRKKESSQREKCTSNINIYINSSLLVKSLPRRFLWKFCEGSTAHKNYTGQNKFVPYFAYFSLSLSYSVLISKICVYGNNDRTRFGTRFQLTNIGFTLHLAPREQTQSQYVQIHSNIVFLHNLPLSTSTQITHTVPKRSQYWAMKTRTNTRKRTVKSVTLLPDPSTAQRGPHSICSIPSWQSKCPLLDIMHMIHSKYVIFLPIPNKGEYKYYTEEICRVFYVYSCIISSSPLHKKIPGWITLWTGVQIYRLK